jgi:hypothetical protein
LSTLRTPGSRPRSPPARPSAELARCDRVPAEVGHPHDTYLALPNCDTMRRIGGWSQTRAQQQSGQADQGQPGRRGLAKPRNVRHEPRPTWSARRLRRGGSKALRPAGGGGGLVIDFDVHGNPDLDPRSALGDPRGSAAGGLQGSLGELAQSCRWRNARRSRRICASGAWTSTCSGRS